MIAKDLDVVAAVDQGYRIALHSDGVADVTKQDGTSYGVDLLIGEHGVCTCPDYQIRGGSYNGACKHMWWVSELTTCTYCKEVMLLSDGIFECVNPECNAAKSLGLVKVQRADRRAAQSAQRA